jgi:bifunctional non-homologous end joining protein LigD
LQYRRRPAEAFESQVSLAVGVTVHPAGTSFHFNDNQYIKGANVSTESITLYYRAAGSDKIYQTALKEKDGGYVVNFAYGRRGSTLQSGTKTIMPVSFNAAKKIYDKLVREKTQKGYTPGANGTPYSGTDNAQRSTGILPQLLNPVDEAKAEKLLADSTHWMQQKLDGKRVIIQVGDKIVGINRKGLTIGLPETIIRSAAKIAMPCILDGEAIGDMFYAFDLLSRNGVDYRASPYRTRYEALVRLIGKGVGSIKIVETYVLATDKRAAFERLNRANTEGVVFKNPSAPYTPGRPASGGAQLKFKFVATGTFIVAGVNAGKRSVGLEVFNTSGQRQYIGNVTVPPNQKMPKLGAFVECRFLYCFREGCLFQPVLLGIRDDVDASACTATQLKYKPEEEDYE